MKHVLLWLSGFSGGVCAAFLYIWLKAPRWNYEDAMNDALRKDDDAA